MINVAIRAGQTGIILNTSFQCRLVYFYRNRAVKINLENDKYIFGKDTIPPVTR
jgi:hypothetical protein